MVHRFFTGLALALIALTLIPTHAFAAGAVNDHTVLILGTSVTGGPSSREAQAASALGYSIEIASDADWLAKSVADFASYRAIIIGDPECNEDHTSIAAAEANAAVWGSAVDGNVLVIGTDPVFHAQWQPGAAQMVTSGIAYVLSAPIADGKTAAYVDLGCSFNDAGAGQPVNVLSAFGNFVVSDNPCHDDIHVTAPSHPAMAGLTDANLSNWDCSIHSLFTTWPSNFQVLAIADGLGSAYTAPDGSVGTPYLLARGGDCSIMPTIVINGVHPPTLWPPNKKMADIYIDATVTGDNVNVTKTVTCNEIPKKPWTVFYEDGVDAWHFKLRSDRNGNNSGRIYTITYTVTDGCGNTTTAVAYVTVPHDQSEH
jgi:hypothetical protein